MGVLSQLRQADHVAHTVLTENGMQIVSIPVHFDRDPTDHIPSCDAPTKVLKIPGKLRWKCGTNPVFCIVVFNLQ